MESACFDLRVVIKAEDAYKTTLTDFLENIREVYPDIEIVHSGIVNSSAKVLIITIPEKQEER